MAKAAPSVGPEGAVSESVSSFPEWSLTYPATDLAPIAVAVESEPSAPLISLSEVTPSTGDILLITLSSDRNNPVGSITKLHTSNNLIISSIASEDTALFLSPNETVTLSSSDDVFVAPAPIATVPRVTEHRPASYAQHTCRTYAKPPPTTQLNLSPDDVHVPVSQMLPVTQGKLNDNSLLKALISRPCMKIPPANIMRPIDIPTTRPIAQQKSKRTRKPKAKSSARTTPVRASTRVSHVPVSLATLNTETRTSFAVTSTMSIFSDPPPISPYVTTASLITIPLTTLSYATTKTYAPCAYKPSVSTPTLFSFTTSTVTSVTTSKRSVKTIHSAGVVASNVWSAFTTATLTSLTTTITTTNVRLISTDNYMTTATRVSNTRSTYVMKARNPPSFAVQSSPSIAVVTGTTAPRSTDIPSSETHFLEPLPVKKSRTAPAARTFSGPRKAKVNQSPSANVSPRVITRHTNPKAFEKILRNPSPVNKTTDAAVTRLSDGSEIINLNAANSGSLPNITPTTAPTITYATTSTGNHTLVVPHYKDTVFKNLSSIAYADPASLGIPRRPTERMVIRRPVAYFSPRRSFACLAPVRTQSTPTVPPAQRTVRSAPVSLAGNPQRARRTNYINLPQGVLTNMIVPDHILAETKSLRALVTPKNVNTTTTS